MPRRRDRTERGKRDAAMRSKSRDQDCAPRDRVVLQAGRAPIALLAFAEKPFHVGPQSRKRPASSTKSAPSPPIPFASSPARNRQSLKGDQCLRGRRLERVVSDACRGGGGGAVVASGKQERSAARSNRAERPPAPTAHLFVGTPDGYHEPDVAAGKGGGLEWSGRWRGCCGGRQGGRINIRANGRGVHTRQHPHPPRDCGRRLQHRRTARWRRWAASYPPTPRQLLRQPHPQPRAACRSKLPPPTSANPLCHTRTRRRPSVVGAAAAPGGGRRRSTNAIAIANRDAYAAPACIWSALVDMAGWRAVAGVDNVAQHVLQPHPATKSARPSASEAKDARLRRPEGVENKPTLLLLLLLLLVVVVVVVVVVV
eukprot:363751-Chlamydomonas_euryale.AAC.6